MTLPELSVKRHVLAWMMSAVLVLVGMTLHLSHLVQTLQSTSFVQQLKA